MAKRNKTVQRILTSVRRMDSGVEHTVQCTDDVLQNGALETYINFSNQCHPTYVIIKQNKIFILNGFKNSTIAETKE